MKTSRPTKFHPLTGAPIRPLGYRKNGRAIWPIMGGSGDGGDGGDAGGDAGADTGADGGDGSGADKGADADADKGDDSPWADPNKAKAEIERLRRENASSRTSAKEQAAKDAEAALIQRLGKTLGLVDGDKAPTAEELAQQLTEQTTQTEQARAAHRDTQAELVVWRHAGDLKVDAQALTDSRAFAAAIKDLDPSDAKFEEDVKKAAQEAVSKNPKLGAAPAAGSSSADHGGTGGGASTSKPKTLTDAVSGHYGT